MARKQLIGIVVSDRMTKTVVVKVTRIVRHPVYKKVMNRFQKYKVHDENSSAHIGDEVRIEETRPISKDKRWRLVEVIKKGIGDQVVKELEAVS